jgi:uncharacterized MAPEG superfamily protein
MVLLYPFALILISLGINLMAFGFEPLVIALPSAGVVTGLAVAVALLLANHTWLMTTTELTRVRFDMAATPEEWAAKGLSPDDAPKQGMDELARRHNLHRNTTENVVYFGLLAVTLAVSSASPTAVQVWTVGFATARLAYTHSYLTGRTGLRGFSMSLSLICLYGMATRVVIGAVISASTPG